MAKITQYSRLQHHTIFGSTYAGATFSIPYQEDFSVLGVPTFSWTEYDLGLSEIGVNEQDNKVYIRIGDNINQILTATPSSVYVDGFFNYSDTGTTQSYTTGSPKIIGCDGLGSQQLTTYKPYGVTRLWNATASQFDFSQLKLGDELNIRLNLNVVTTSINQTFEFYLLLGVGIYNYTINDGDFYFKSTGSHQIGVTIPIFIGNTQTRDYPGQIMFSSDANASVIMNSIYISTKRRQ